MQKNSKAGTGSSSTVERLVQQMFEKIKNQEWKVGEKIPGERKLIEEFGVSRIPLREALSHLKALGILDISHGKSTRVRKLDLKAMSHLFPLMMALDERQTFGHLFDARLLIESETAFLAATQRTEEDLEQLQYLAEKYERHVLNKEIDEAAETDILLHQTIAFASRNPIYPMMLNGISGFTYGLFLVSRKDEIRRRKKSAEFHFQIVAAIRDQRAEEARSGMKAHLEYSRDGIREAGYLSEPIRTTP